MDIKGNIKTLLREIELYRSHSLFEEAKEKCQKLAKLVHQDDRIKNKQKLLNVVTEKVKDLEKESRKAGAEIAAAQMTTKEQALVKKLFTFSKNKGADSAAFEGAIALLVFGQFEKALSEFNELIKRDSLRVVAAKNIIRCHIGLSSLNDAVTQYNQWVKSDQFPLEELEKIRSFLQGILNKRGTGQNLAKPETIADVKGAERQEDEFIDILSIKLPIGEESKDGKGFTLDVSYQEGSMISVIIPSINQILIDRLKVGLRIDAVQFNSNAVVFNESCVVSSTNQINSGLQKGNYVLALKILNVEK